MPPEVQSSFIRDTRQRRAIRAAFEQADRPLSTEQLHAVASRRSRGLGIATVYRSIKALIDEGWLDVIEVPGRGAYYEMAGKDHHHHFACEACGDVIDLEGCSSDIRAQLPRGYRVRGHDVTIFGTCPRCGPERSTGPRRRT